MRLKKSKVEMVTLLKETLQNETFYDSAIRRWHRAFINSRESAKIEYVSGRQNCCGGCQHQHNVSGEWKGPSFIYSKAGRWPTLPENVNSAHFNKGAQNEVCLFNVGSSFPLDQRNGLLSSVYGKFGKNFPRSRPPLSCHHCWWILDLSLRS